MRKYLVLFGAVVLVLALASPSKAQFSSWGHMEIQTIWEKNRDLNVGTKTYTDSTGGAANRDQTTRHVAERFRFYLQYGDPKTVRAVIGFEADSSDWGQLRPSTADPKPTGGAMGGYTADSVQLEIKHAFLDFVIPGTPLSVRAGIQDYWYGGRLFVNNDAPGLKLITDFAPHKIQAFWWRENDNDRYSNRVNDTYGLAWDMREKEFNVYAWTAYKNDLSMIGGDYKDSPWWIGVGAGFRPGNLDFSAQFVYVTGERDYTVATDKDYKAWAAEVAAKYKIGPGMFMGLEGFYCTGNDADKTNEISLYPVATASEGRSIFGNDRTVFFWMNAAQMGYYHNREIDFSGMWYGRVNFEYSPLATLRFNLNYLYIGDTSKGTAGKAGINSPLGGRTDKDEDLIGQEINLITSITIYKNFVYHIGLAYFIPGAVYDTATKSAEEAYAFNSKLVYAF